MYRASPGLGGCAHPKLPGTALAIGLAGTDRLPTRSRRVEAHSTPGTRLSGKSGVSEQSRARTVRLVPGCSFRTPLRGTDTVPGGDSYSRLRVPARGHSSSCRNRPTYSESEPALETVEARRQNGVRASRYRGQAKSFPL